MSNTLSALRQELGLVLGGCKTGTTTATGDSTSVIDTTNFTDSYMNANFYDGHYLIMTSGDRATEIRRVSSYSGSAGDFTLADALTGAPGASKTFEVHSYDPARLKEAINRALGRMYYWTYAYPTLVADGDMEGSGVTDWTTSTCTATKETTIVKYGTQSLKTVTSGASGYARTASMSVTAGNTYYCEVTVRPDTYNVTLVAYDATNAANITTATCTGREWKRLWIQFSIPSGCTQLQLWLQSTENPATTYWDNLILQHIDDHRLALPSWLTETGNVVTVERRIGDRTQASGVYYVDEEHWYRLQPQPTVEEDRTAVNQFYLQFTSAVADKPLRALCVRPYASLSSDTSTTMAPKEWVVAGALVELMRMQVLKAPGNETGEFKNQMSAWKKDFERLCRTYQPRVPVVVRCPWDE